MSSHSAWYTGIVWFSPAPWSVVCTRLSLSFCMGSDLANVRFELFTVALLKILVFWGVTPCWLASRYRRFKDTYPWAAWHWWWWHNFFRNFGTNWLVDRASHPRRLESSGLRLSVSYLWDTTTCRSISAVQRAESCSNRHYINNLMMERSSARGKYKAFLRRIFLKDCEK
jgi:hypothetical protein